jgi:hypothetical protein
VTFRTMANREATLRLSVGWSHGTPRRRETYFVGPERAMTVAIKATRPFTPALSKMAVR